MEKIEINQNNTNEESKKGSKVPLIITIIFIFVAIVVVCGVFVFSEETKEELSISNAQLSVEYNEYLGYSAKITGVAKNVTNRDFSYASIEYAIYDANGNNLGTALDNINNLLSGDTWRFEANLFSFPSSKPVSFKLIEITAW